MPVDYAGLIAKLTREPFCLTPAEVGRLTVRQLDIVYARDPSKPPRRMAVVNSEGVEEQAGPVQDYKSLFYDIWRKRGLATEAIDVKWQEQQREIRFDGPNPAEHGS